MSARSDFSFIKKLQIKLLLSSTMSSQCCLPPKVGVDGELMSKKSLSPKNFEQGPACLLMAHCLALPKAQSLHSLKVLLTWIPKVLVVTWVMDLEGCPSSMCRSLMFFLYENVADCALTLCVSWRNSTPVTQPSKVLIQGSRMMLPLVLLTTVLLWWSLEILLPCKCFHIRENRFAPALGQNFIGHRVCTHSAPSTCWTLTFSLSFGATLDWLINVSDVIHTGIIFSDMAWCTWVSNLGIFGEGIKHVVINGAYHTSLGGLFYIFH